MPSTRSRSPRESRYAHAEVKITTTVSAATARTRKRCTFASRPGSAATIRGQSVPTIFGRLAPAIDGWSVAATCDAFARFRSRAAGGSETGASSV